MKDIIIGFDIGGTNVRMAFYECHSQKLLSIEINKFHYEAFAEDEVRINVVEPIRKFLNKHKDLRLCGIGISTAALFDRNNGNIIIWPNNQKWNGFPFKSFVQDFFNVPVFMEDDANSAAMGEHLMGAGKGLDSFLYVTVSTGIGCGIVHNNGLFIGDHGFAGELGHIKLLNEDSVCTCGARGCLQAVASGTAILKKYVSKKEMVPDLHAVVERALNGDDYAAELFDYAGRCIGQSIGNMMLLFDISAVVLGGGGVEAGDIIVNPIKREIENTLLMNREYKFFLAQLKSENGAIGAVNLVLQKLLNGEDK